MAGNQGRGGRKAPTAPKEVRYDTRADTRSSMVTQAQGQVAQKSVACQKVDQERGGSCGEGSLPVAHPLGVGKPYGGDGEPGAIGKIKGS